MNKEIEKNIINPTGNVFKRASGSADEYEPLSDQLFFDLVDRDGKHVQLAVTDLLACLRFAEDCKQLPEHDKKWWYKVQNFYGIEIPHSNAE